MKTPNYPSIEQFKVFVELKDFVTIQVDCDLKQC